MPLIKDSSRFVTFTKALNSPNRQADNASGTIHR